jgi:hypothetical protein
VPILGVPLAVLLQVASLVKLGRTTAQVKPGHVDEKVNTFEPVTL